MPRPRAKPSAKVPAPSFAIPRHVAVEGPLRVGKSTLARFLAERMHARRALDCEDNPFHHEDPGSATPLPAAIYFRHGSV